MRILGTLLLIITCPILIAQSVGEKELSKLYQIQFNLFYQSDYVGVLETYDSIQLLTSTVSVESIKMTLSACEQLMKIDQNTFSKIELTKRSEFLDALLRLKQSFEAQTEIKFDNSINRNSYIENYERNTFYQKNGKFIRDNRRYSISEIADDLQMYEESKSEYLLYRKNTKIAILFFAGSLASYTTAILLESNGSNGSIPFAIGFASNIAVIPFGMKSTNHLRKSVWHYNKKAAIGGLK